MKFRHVRSIVLSLCPPSPLLVGTPGVVSNSSPLPAAHSSILLEVGERGKPGGDHLGEWQLKSPMIKVGVVTSMSRSSKACSVAPDLSPTS